MTTHHLRLFILQPTSVKSTDDILYERSNSFNTKTGTYIAYVFTDMLRPGVLEKKQEQVLQNHMNAPRTCANHIQQKPLKVKQ